MTEEKSGPPQPLSARADEDEGASAPETSGSRGGDGSPPRPERPASVRETMRPTRRYQPAPRWSKRPAQPAPQRRGSAPPPARGMSPSPQPEAEVRRVEVAGELWTVRVRGSTDVGSGTDRGPRLLSVCLEAPEQHSSPRRTAYLLAKTLGDVAEEALVALVEGATREPDVTSGSTNRRRRTGRHGRYGRRGTGRVS